MVGPSKILTVSYGTFSCTLEGFDDPFSTMKSIAEYFRDLAADDRYFGAEPPQPDPAMLHRIAEREVHRRVEARVQDNGVILRAADAPAAAAAPPSYTPAYVPAGHASPLSESVAAKLQRLRQAAAGIPAFVPVPEEAEILPEPAEAAAAMPEFEVPAEEPVVHVAPEPSEAAVEAQSEPVEAPVFEAADEAVAEEEIAVDAQDIVVADAQDVPQQEAEAAELPADAGEVAIEAQPEPGDVIEDVAEEESAASVADLSASDAWDDADQAAMSDDADEVEAPAAAEDASGEADETMVSRMMAEAVEDWDGPEADLTADVAPMAADDDADLMASLAAALAGPADEILPGIEASPEPEAAEEAMLAALVEDADDDADKPAAEDATADDAAFEAALLAAADMPLPEADAMIEDEELLSPLSEHEAEAAEAAFNPDIPEIEEAVALGATDGEPVADVPEAAAEAAATESVAAEVPAAAEPAAEVAESQVSAGKLQRARARVIKIRRAEPQPPVPSLTPEAEADLERELDALKSEAPAHPQLPDATAETSMQRLIDQTNSQLDGAENRRRHAAIEHLKAAVAATAADRRATGGAEDTAEATRLNAYRSDLERVVRPRRPMPSAEKTAIPGVTVTMRPTPLVLVSAQRIDRPEPTLVPVRPRRVAGSALAVSPEAQVEAEVDDADDDENLFSPARGFAEFAERLGAEDLPDLLEAAVAYAACVEGRPHVSRPYMLRQVGSTMPDAEAKRDEMLQGFGRLLRGGRIEKVRAGLYALPGSSRMMAEAKKIAG